MELYINSEWTGCYGDVHIAEAVAWSEHGNHAAICTTGDTAKDAYAKLMAALRELNLMPETAMKDEW
jgi:hypothetical protein